MATHHGKEGVVTVGGTAIGNVTGYTLDTTQDVVEATALEDSNKSFLVGRGTFTAFKFCLFTRGKWFWRWKF